MPFREPDKNPTQLEQVRCTEEYYPELVQQVRELERHQKTLQDQEEDVQFRLGPIQERDDVGNCLDSSPPPLNYVDSSDVESNAGSIDSIQRNADFVQF